MSEQALRDWLQFSVDARRKLGFKSPSEMAYCCLEDYVLQNGTFYKPRSLPEAYPLMAAQQCFYNAFTLVEENPELRFCEGYAEGSIIPVHHAWCLDPDDRVIDPTLEGEAYLGIVFDLAQVREVIDRHETYSVIDNWMDGWPLLRRKEAV